MKDWRSQAHVKWDCKYHVVILPKYRKKERYGRVRHEIGRILRDLCRQKGIGLDQGELDFNQRPLLGAFLIPPALPVVGDSHSGHHSFPFRFTSDTVGRQPRSANSHKAVSSQTISRFAASNVACRRVV